MGLCGLEREEAIVGWTDIVMKRYIICAVRQNQIKGAEMGNAYQTLKRTDVPTRLKELCH
jgi:hypothetical protein